MDKLGYPYDDFTDYRRVPQEGGAVLLHHLRANFVPLLELPQIGDIVVFWLARKGRPQHTGILTDHGLIHAFSQPEGPGRVCEHVLNDYWYQRLHSAYRFEESA